MIPSTSPEFRRFIVAGVINTLSSYAVYLGLLQFVSYEVAYTLSTVTGVLLAYALSTKYVFRSTWSWSKLVRFPGVYVVQYVTGMALMWLLVEKLGVDDRLAPWVVLAIQVPPTFYLSRRIVADRGAPTHDNG
jgi:putative flippase GtrA